jgi:hypothetical protein
MEHNKYTIVPGDCFRCQSDAGIVKIAQVISVLNDGSLSMYFWTIDPHQNYYLPTVGLGSNEEGVIPTPVSLSSLVFFCIMLMLLRLIRKPLLMVKEICFVTERYLTI